MSKMSALHADVTSHASWLLEGVERAQPTKSQIYSVSLHTAQHLGVPVVYVRPIVEEMWQEMYDNRLEAS